jgi:poly-gamma-glutamate synthesis protein (capsule biosynthesis protein)
MPLVHNKWQNHIKNTAELLRIAMVIPLILVGLLVIVMFYLTQVFKPTESASLNFSPTPSSTPTIQVVEPSEPEFITLVFVGDMMFDRNIRSKAEQQGNYKFILEPMREIFSEADLIIGNLEGPITSNKSRSQGSVPGSTDNFFFTFDPAILDALREYPFVLNLGNNHITNFGEDGIDQTLSFLNAANLPFFGQIGREPETEYKVLQVGSLQIGLVNYNEFLPGGIQKTLAAIAASEEKADLTIVYTHWGTEYAPVANQVIQSQAYSFVDAGADLVIGSHPHVVQNSEIYQGKKIYYSLGNFVFDQYFSSEVQQGMVVKATIDSTSLEILTSEQMVTLDQSGVTRPVGELR